MFWQHFCFFLQIFGTELVNNEAQRGGAVDVQNSQTNVLVQNSTFRYNSAEYKGSDVYATEIQQLRIANSQFISAASELEVSSIYYHVNTGRIYQSYSVPLRFWNTTFSAANRILVSSSNNFSDVAVEENFIEKVVMQQANVTLHIRETYYASGMAISLPPAKEVAGR